MLKQSATKALPLTLRSMSLLVSMFLTLPALLREIKDGPSQKYVARMPLTRATKNILTSWVDNPQTLSDADKWTGAELWKRHFRVMTFQLRSSNGARLRLIKINGVLFAVLKCRVQQKRPRPRRDKKSVRAEGWYGTVSLWVQKLTQKFQMNKQKEQKERKINTYSRWSGSC
jgi:hypothetical protein